MIQFKLFSIQFMADDNTINWKEQTITIRHAIKLIHLTITHYPEQKHIIKKTNDIVYNWNKFIKYWYKHLPEYTKAFNIDFDTLTLDVDYSIAPIYSNNDSLNDNIYIGIYIFNKNIIKDINMKNTINTKNTINNIINIQEKNNKIVSYSFLSIIEPYLLSLSNTKNNNKTINHTNKYNFMYGILSNNSNSYTDNLKNKMFILDTKLIIPLKYILQNSMNYLPKLEINRIKMNSQNLLNP